MTSDDQHMLHRMLFRHILIDMYLAGAKRKQRSYAKKIGPGTDAVQAQQLS
jgi:hypothetical protein